jgi:hypothetical protein
MLFRITIINSPDNIDYKSPAPVRMAQALPDCVIQAGGRATASCGRANSKYSTINLDWAFACRPKRSEGGFIACQPAGWEFKNKISLEQNEI